MKKLFLILSGICYIFFLKAEENSFVTCFVDKIFECQCDLDDLNRIIRDRKLFARSVVDHFRNEQSAICTMQYEQEGEVIREETYAFNESQLKSLPHFVLRINDFILKGNNIKQYENDVKQYELEFLVRLIWQKINTFGGLREFVFPSSMFERYNKSEIIISIDLE